MSPIPRRRNKAIASPRHLPLRHYRRLLSGKAPEKLNPGEERLYSFYSPGLEAGKPYTVSAKQTVQVHGSSSSPLVLEASHEFSVDAPQFSLPAASIYSVYPPQGYSDEHRVLPHIVLDDPHLPWERRGTSTNDPHPTRSRVPWLALLTFTQDELLIEDMDIFSSTSSDLAKPVKQSTTQAINMKILDLMKTNNTITPISKLPGIDQDTRTDVVFIKAELFRDLVSNFDGKGQRIDKNKPDLSRYKFLAHVRDINTRGMADAGVEEDGVFSIVLAHRAGPLDNKTPTTVAAHLVSIEGVENMTLPVDTTYVALSSLYSWIYTCLPQGMLNVVDAFTNLGATLDTLRAPQAIVDDLVKQGEDVATRIAKRLKDGYSLTQYRLQTGELTAALTRGPLVPTTVDHPLKKEWTSLSNFGTDLQILDSDVGVMDISYSSAWQLGRTLALADQTFSAALSRLRVQIYDQAMKDAKIDVMQKLDAYRSKENVIGRLEAIIRQLQSFSGTASDDNEEDNDDGSASESSSESSSATGATGNWTNVFSNFTSFDPVRRWHTFHPEPIPPLTYRHGQISKLFPNHATHAARKLASSPDGGAYNEINSPSSTDWMTVLSWVLDRMYLAGIPAHYLITDPTYLAHESLRFFHIDANWIDALIDGALSIGNHMGEDKTRVAIKNAINDYLTVTSDNKFPPQIPNYGFLMRSDLVSMFPDMKVSAPRRYDDGKLDILRHEIIGDGVMLCLFDRVPARDQLFELVFSQPPHQQRFAIAASVDDTKFTTTYRREYTVENPKDPKKNEVLKTTTSHPGDNDPIFLWDGKTPKLRTLCLPRYADVLLDVLKTMDKKYFDDDVATSALVALQLDDPIYCLKISLKDGIAKERLGYHDKPMSIESRKLTRLEVKSHMEKPSSWPSDKDLVTRVKHLEKSVDLQATVVNRLMPQSHYKYGRSPHVRRIPTFKASQSSESATPSGATNPTFKMGIYSPLNDFIKIDEDVPQDLIFSVQLTYGQTSDYNFRELAIILRLAPKDDPDYNAICASYTGPGATMLSNLRFNVFPAIEPDDNKDYEFLVLRILPRSEKGYIKLTYVKEMSFLLCLVDVNKYDEETLVTVNCRAIYGSDPDDLKVFTDSFTVTLKPA